MPQSRELCTLDLDTLQLSELSLNITVRLLTVAAPPRRLCHAVAQGGGRSKHILAHSKQVNDHRSNQAWHHAGMKAQQQLQLIDDRHEMGGDLVQHFAAVHALVARPWRPPAPASAVSHALSLMGLCLCACASRCRVLACLRAFALSLT